MPSHRRERWRRIGGIVREERARLTIVALASLLAGIVEAAFLVIVTQTALAVTNGETTFDVGAGMDMTVGGAVTVAMGLVVVRAGLALLTVRSTTHMALAVGLTLKRRLANAFLRASWATQQAEPAGRLQQLVSGFGSSAVGVLNALTTAITAGLSLGALLAVAVAVSPLTTLLAVGALLVLGSVLAPLRRAIRRRSQDAARTNLSTAAQITELAGLGLEMQTYGVQDAFTRRISEVIETEARMNARADQLRALIAPTYTSLGYLALVVGLGVAAAADVSDLAAVGAVMLVMLRGLGYGQSLQLSVANLVSAIPFLEIVDETLERFEHATAPTGAQPIARIGVIEANEVTFEYEIGSPVLRGLSFRIEHGEHIGVVGPSGSGKSTLVQVLLGLRSPTSGSLVFGGIPIEHIDRRTLAPRVAFVAQDAELFAGTIAENVAFFREDVTRGDIERAATGARLAEDLAMMPEGLDTHVGERGTRLSGGQRQRVSIARALAGAPELLVLDEPTSALDVYSEAAIRQTIADLRGRITVVIIAHRLSTLEQCDRVMVIQDGELLAFEPPSALAEHSAFYREALALSNVR